jgi:hypothetical protein
MGWVASKSKKFISRETCEELRVKQSKVDWCNMVWFSMAKPKHAFILRVAMKDWLSTGDAN